MNLWRELNRIVWRRTAQHNAYLTSTLTWLFSAIGLFLVIVNATDIAGYFSKRDPTGYGLWAKWIPFPGFLANQNGGDPTPVIFIAITLTLFARFIGALLFSAVAVFGRRRVLLLIVIASCSVVQFLSGLLPIRWPSFTLFIVLRVIYGLAMGGAWSVGAIVTMDWFRAKQGDMQPRWMPQLSDTPQRKDFGRGLISGFFQQGYSAGNLVAALLALLFALSHPEDPSHSAWTQLFMIGGALGALPLLVCVLWLPFGESATWAVRRQIREPRRSERTAPTRGDVWRATRVFVSAALLMVAFSSTSHSSLDVYPTFLGGKQINLSHPEVQIVVIIYTFGAVIGELIFGYHSDRFGRRRCILATVLLGILLIPLWVGIFPWRIGVGAPSMKLNLLSPQVVMLILGAFLMQFMLHGAGGVQPAYLYEMFALDDPKHALTHQIWWGMFPAIFYHGGVLASAFAPIAVAAVALHFGAPGNPNYALGQAIVLAVVFLAMFLFTLLAPSTSPTGAAPDKRTVATQPAMPSKATLAP